MYRALYRKWRPQTFEDVVGQNAITTALSNQILADKVGHAYLFTGTRGTGKTTCAKIFAKAVNCEARNGANPCGACPSCVGLENGSILDVSEIDAASNNSVDDVRALREETAYRPSRGQYRVYIIDEVHMLSTSAFNALLKIMEEPPSHVIFILATTEIHKVPATILSRCQRFDFGRIEPELIAGRLEYVAGQEGIKLEPEAAGLIARLADGAMRDALSLLDTCAGSADVVDEALVRRMAGVADRDYLFALSNAAATGDVAALVGQVGLLRERSVDAKRLGEELVYHYRNLMLACVQPDGSLLDSLPDREREQYLANAPKIGQQGSINGVRRLAAALDKMGRSPNPRVELELALFDLTNPLAEEAEVGSTAAPRAVLRQPPVPEAPPAPKPVQAQEPVAKETAPQKVEPAVPQQPAAPALPKAEPAAPPAPPLPPTPQGDTLPVFAQWPQVVEVMAGIDPMLYSFMQQSNAYMEGKRVLIEGGDMFLTYMRDYPEASDRVKDAMEKICGIRYALGPYTPKTGEAKRQISPQQRLEEWQKAGVDVREE